MPSAETPIARGRADQPDSMPEDPYNTPVHRTTEELRAKGFSEDAINEVISRVRPLREVAWERLEQDAHRTGMLIDANYESMLAARAMMELVKKSSDEHMQLLMKLKAEVADMDSEIVELYRARGEPLPSYYKRPQF
ncbi:hypothetical protein FA95DRAFT_784107 [Auriscalpium vulgare]|uniref:Uncharacterized protein n=1 Tax=Auriscalpium vulgare TaxID=40419 RepID=A0ACB8RAI4_9AGAM|nr:hypothetical protein FA95DRAFT_784107 [Auriscalpium vulgare]